MGCPAALASAGCIHGTPRNRRTGSLLVCAKRSRCRVARFNFVASAAPINIGTQLFNRAWHVRGSLSAFHLFETVVIVSRRATFYSAEAVPLCRKFVEPRSGL